MAAVQPHINPGNRKPLNYENQTRKDDTYAILFFGREVKALMYTCWKRHTRFPAQRFLVCKEGALDLHDFRRDDNG